MSELPIDLEKRLEQARATDQNQGITVEAEFIRSELSVIAQIIRDECWLEGERRGAGVDPKDPAVQTRVADVILSGVGAQLRQNHEQGSAPQN